MEVKMEVLSHGYNWEVVLNKCNFFVCTYQFFLQRRGEHHPLVRLLLGAINRNVSWLSKWWDLTYGIKASLDQFPLQSLFFQKGFSTKGRPSEGRGRIRWLVTHAHCVWITVYFIVFEDLMKPSSPWWGTWHNLLAKGLQGKSNKLWYFYLICYFGLHCWCTYTHSIHQLLLWLANYFSSLLTPYVV